MKTIIHPSKQKFVVVFVAALLSFFGFQIMSQTLQAFQIPSFIAQSFYVYLFLLLWQTFIFDLHLKRADSWLGWERSIWQALRRRFQYLKEARHWRHFQNYLILPGLLYWATVGILFLNPFDHLRKQVWIALATLALACAIWYLKTVFYAHRETSRPTRQIIFLTKLFASYVSLTAVIGIGRYFGYSALWVGLAAFAVTFLLFYQALFQHHFFTFKTLKLALLAGAVLAAAAVLIHLFWSVNYYSGALILAAVYNAIWGIAQHKYIDQNLTREIVYEYLAVLFVIFVIVFSTTNFAERI